MALVKGTLDVLVLTVEPTYPGIWISARPMRET